MSKQLSPADMKSDSRVTLDYGIHFADLTFGDLLGQGAYGKVFAGEWQFNAVAIKQYAAQDFSDQTKQEILKEAKIMATASTQSDYLVRLRGIILEKPQYSLVMEYMPGGDLFHLLKSSQELTWPMRYRISLDMTIGLHHLHQRDILHRDLKSLNVLLDMNFRAKLADFGLSTLKISSTSMTAGGLKGTPRWLSPELFKRGAKATTASDMYALAMIFWELITRQIPFADAPSQEVAIDWIKSGEQENIPEGTPEEFKAIILGCWNKDPAQRPKAEVVAKQLDTLWQTERKKVPIAPHSPASPASDSVMIPTLTDSSTLPSETMPLPRKSPGSPKAAIAGAEDEKMKELLAEVIRLKLEKAELERRHTDEKEIQRQPPEQREKLTPVKPGKPVDSKPESSVQPLSQSRFTMTPSPKPVIPRLDRGIQPVDQKALSQLLQYVAEGEQDKAEALIQKNKNLLLHTGTVKDLSVREFKPITAFQYALWALDWHMWTMIQKYLPKEAQTEQLQALETKGTAHGKHFSLQELTNALQVYVDNAEKWNYDQRAVTQWCKVGVEQNKLPAQVVNEYCRGDRPFHPCPQEWESKLPRTREMDVYDNTQSKWVKGSWFIAPSSKDVLGVNFAFYRVHSGERACACAFSRGRVWASQPCADLIALQSLWKTRTQQLELLKSQLLSVVSQSQAFGS